MTGLSGLQLRSLMTPEGELRLTLARVAVPEPGPGEVVVKVQATPINPSDLGLLIGPADLSAAKVTGEGEGRTVTAPVDKRFLRAFAARLGQDLPVGNEGAGVVVAAGSSAEAQALLGKTVTMAGGSMYATCRTARVSEVMDLGAEISAAEGASAFVNPLTALGMVETMRMEKHTALVHTAAASNLGQMLNRLCLSEGVGLVNIVRSGEQAAILKEQGAVHVVDSSAPSFIEDLTSAIEKTGASIAFDAIGGGKLASQILAAMEVAAQRRMTEYSRYGSTTFKQVYIYGGLDMGPTELTRSYGFSWSLGGWLLTPFLQKVGPAETKRLRETVRAGLKTIFASRYTATISLAQALDLEIMRAYNRRATGEKYLIDPSL